MLGSNKSKMSYTSIAVEYKENYVIVQLDGGKVNQINTAMLQDLKDIFLALDQDDSVQGVILSGRPHGFSAGLDIASLSSGGVEYAQVFWRCFHETLQALIRFSKPFVCAITGYAPAGGTILTLCADYRIMGKGPKHVIGMHELKLSMLIPKIFSDIYAYHLGEKQAWEAVQLKKLFNSDEALEVGLVNESVPVEEVLDRAEVYLKSLLNVYPPVFIETKRLMRQNLLKIVEGDLSKEIADVVSNFSDPHTQTVMQEFMNNFKK